MIGVVVSPVRDLGQKETLVMMMDYVFAVEYESQCYCSQEEVDLFCYPRVRDRC